MSEFSWMQIYVIRRFDD
uniref:Uncharacterized protein n=1 Tax=Rhizophora mucronata TaxID=61149 RepID=A0A2P2IXE8_RHIMU